MSSLERKDRHWQTVKQLKPDKPTLFQTIKETNFFTYGVFDIIFEYAHEISLFSIGGYDGPSYLNTMERFDLAKNVWEEMPSMNSKRAAFGVVAVGNYLYAIGGYNSGSEDGLFYILNTMERFNIATQEWEEMPSMKSKRSRLGVVAV